MSTLTLIFRFYVKVPIEEWTTRAVLHILLKYAAIYDGTSPQTLIGYAPCAAAVQGNGMTVRSAQVLLGVLPLSFMPRLAIIGWPTEIAKAQIYISAQFGFCVINTKQNLGVRSDRVQTNISSTPKSVSRYS